jgi:PilZ domain-containing protein
MSAPPTKETRRHRRFNVDVEAVVHAASGDAFTARTRDLSHSGICLITSSALPGNSWVEIDLVLAFGDNAFSEPLRLDARVVWCTPIGDSFQVGAMFSELTQETAEFLDMFLRYLDGSLAPRGQGGEEEEEREDTPPPDVKDDPFRH